MKVVQSRRHVSLTCSTSTLIPNYEIIRQDAQIPRIDSATERYQLLFLRNPGYKVLRETMPLPEKRLLNIPRARINNWNNYIVHSKHPDYLESWREDRKLPVNS